MTDQLHLVHPSLWQIIDFVSRWLQSSPMVATLVMLIVGDIIAGILVAANKRTLNSTISFRGITRKVFTMLLVGMASVLEPYAQGLPLAKLVALFYIVTEAISITENAAALGVPLPRTLTEMLIKLKDDQQKRITQKLPKTVIEVPAADEGTGATKVLIAPVKKPGDTAVPIILLLASLLLSGCATRTYDPVTGKKTFETYADIDGLELKAGAVELKAKSMKHSTPTRAAGALIGTTLSGVTAIGVAAGLGGAPVGVGGR